MNNLENLTILYVEDELGTRDNLMYYLQNSFKKVFCAGDGLEGLEIFKREPSIDLIISDIYMPKMDGLMMIKEMKKINPKIPFLLITAHNNQEYMLEAIELGAISYVVKPVDIKVLFQKIEFAYKSIYEQKSLDILTKKVALLTSLNIEQFSIALDKALEEMSPKNHFLLLDNYQYDFNNKYITKADKIITLNNQEIKVLEYLIKNQNQIVPYEALIHYISPDNFSLDILRTIIKSLRKKTNKDIIKNLSGVGYKIDV